MILTGRELQEIGEILYGPKWRRALAEKLDRSERTLFGYTKENKVVPRAVRDKLVVLCREQSTHLAGYAELLISDLSEVE